MDGIKKAKWLLEKIRSIIDNVYMARTKKHHYLPQFYLRGFATASNGDQIWRIEKSAEARSFLTSVRDSGAESDYHTINREDGEPDSSTVEQELSKLETLHSSVISKILRKEQISKIDRQHISAFLSLMRVRVPAFKRFVEDQNVAAVKAISKLMAKGKRLEEIVEKHKIPILEGVTGAAREATFEQMRTMINGDMFTIEIANSQLLSLMFTTAFESKVIGAISRMRLRIMDVPFGSHLITCDQPVSLFQPIMGDIVSPGALIDPVTQLSMPLSRYCLAFLDWSNGPDEGGTLTVEQVEEFNRRTAVMADSVIFSPKEDLRVIRTIQKLHAFRAGFKSHSMDVPGKEGTYVVGGMMPVLPAIRYGVAQDGS